MASRREEGCYDHNIFKSCIVWKELLLLSNYDVGVARGTILQEIRPGTGFKNGDFVQENKGGLP